MKSLLPLGLIVAALVAAAAVPAASAKPAPAFTLSNLPLPASAIGVVAKSLPLQRADSGWTQDGSGDVTTPNRSLGFVGPVLTKLGWENGYALDYGLGASGGTGITEVRSSVDRYRTSADAWKALAAYRTIDSQVTRWSGGGLSISAASKCQGVGGSRNLRFIVSYSARNITPLFAFDHHFTVGRYVGDVTVWAGTEARAERLVPALVTKLAARIKRGMAGNLHAKVIKLPPQQQAGQAPGGPDLSVLALQPTDLSGGGTVTQFAHNYTAHGPFSPFGLSTYWADFIPAGKYTFLSQAIQWFATPNQASFQADFESSLFGRHRVDVSGVGDGARGLLTNGGSGDSTGYAEVVFLSGQLEEDVIFSSSSTIHPYEVREIAHTMAGYINAAGLGS